MTTNKVCQWVIREVEDDFVLAALWIMIMTLSVVPAVTIPQSCVDVTNRVLICLCTGRTAWGIMNNVRKGRVIANAIISMAVTLGASVAIGQREALSLMYPPTNHFVIGFSLGAYVCALGIRIFQRRATTRR